MARVNHATHNDPFFTVNKGLALGFTRVTQARTQTRARKECTRGRGVGRSVSCPVHCRNGPSCTGSWKSRGLSRSIREIFLSAHHARGGRRLCVIHFPRSARQGEPDTGPHSERAPPSGLRRDCRWRRKGRESTEDQAPPCSWPRGDATQPAEN